jgi:hypothetical protein
MKPMLRNGNPMNKILLVPIALALMMVACDSNPPKPAQSAATNSAPEYTTGRAVFQKLFVSARSLAADVKPYRLESIYTPGSPVEKGQAGIWRGGFASPGRRLIKSYVWSGLNSPDAPEKGISRGTEDTYSPTNTTTLIWELPFLKIDTDQAFEAAQKQGGDKIMKKDPKQPVTFVLDWDKPKNQLVWHVLYGKTPQDAKLRIAVDASTGAYLRTEH